MTERLLREIAEQVAVSRRVLDAREPEAAARALARVRFLYVAARGSSDNAATYAKYLFESRRGIAVALAAPSVFTLYRSPPDLRAAGVIGVSQSGAAPDVAAVLAAARRAGAVTVAVTNAPRSLVARAAEHVVPLRAGREQSVAAKTYVATCLALARIAGAPVERAPEAIAAALALRRDAERLARAVRGAALAVLGRGFAYATALEVALKVKELAGMWAEPYSTADFRHGPQALAVPGTTALLIGARGPALVGMAALARALRRRGVRVLALTDDERLASASDEAALLDVEVPEHLAALALVVPGQYLARALALRRGRDPERPRGLRKVTRTR